MHEQQIQNAQQKRVLLLQPTIGASRGGECTDVEYVENSRNGKGQNYGYPSPPLLTYRQNGSKQQSLFYGTLTYYYN